MSYLFNDLYLIPYLRYRTNRLFHLIQIANQIGLILLVKILCLYFATTTSVTKCVLVVIQSRDDVITTNTYSCLNFTAQTCLNRTFLHD